MLLQEICNWIVLIAAVFGAIAAIYKVIGKPFKFFDKKKRAKQKADTLDLLDQLMPQYFEPIYMELEEIRNINTDQSETMELLRRNLQDVLRQQIEEIYDSYGPNGPLPYYVKENLDELYHDYKAANGNHHVDKLYKRMCTWPITQEKSKYDLDD